MAYLPKPSLFSLLVCIRLERQLAFDYFHALFRDRLIDLITLYPKVSLCRSSAARAVSEDCGGRHRSQAGHTVTFQGTREALSSPRASARPNHSLFPTQDARVAKDGVDKGPFWSEKKRFPTPATYDPADSTHVQFMLATTHLIAAMLGVHAPYPGNDPSWLADMRSPEVGQRAQTTK
jgi:hypothetical protein